MNEQVKDPIVGFKSSQVGRNKSVNDLNPQGGQYIQLGMSQEQAQAMYKAIGAALENPNGVKLAVHINKKKNQDETSPRFGQVFESAFCFVKPIGEAPARTAFVPKAAPATTPGRAAAAKVTKQLSE